MSRPPESEDAARGVGGGGARQVSLLGGWGGDAIYVRESIGLFVLRPSARGSPHSALGNNPPSPQNTRSEREKNKKNRAISKRTKHLDLNWFFLILRLCIHLPAERRHYETKVELLIEKELPMP